MSLTRVFVYGTLQRGGYYHPVLTEAPFLGVVWTPPRYTLVDVGWYPGLLQGGSTSVRGEVFAVDAAVLAKMDEIEEVPEVYLRRPIELAGFSEVQAYFLRPEEARGCRRIDGGVWSPG